MATAYCLKCRVKREMRTPQRVTLKNGRVATKATCPHCGSTMYRIGKAGGGSGGGGKGEGRRGGEGP